MTTEERTHPTLLAFSDLDGTLMTRQRPPGGGWPVAEVDREGQPRSWRSPAQQALLELLARGGAELILVSGRDEASMARLRWPGEAPEWAVTHQGMRITRGGNELTDWSELCRSVLLTLQDELAWATELMGRLLGQRGARVHANTIGGLQHQAVARWPGDGQTLEYAWVIHDQLEGHPLVMHDDGRTLKVVPGNLGKREACTWLRTRHFPGVPTLALGDSPQDLGFMLDQDFAAFPTEGTIGARMRR